MSLNVRKYLKHQVNKLSYKEYINMLMSYGFEKPIRIKVSTCNNITESIRMPHPYVDLIKVA